MKIKPLKGWFSLFFIFLSLQLFALTTKNDQIVDSAGNPIELKGVNWFGFNNQSTMVDGLWTGPDQLSLDFATVVYRMQLLGFNAVRLPFSFQDLFNLPPRNFTQSCTFDSQSDIQASVTDPSVPVDGKTIPPQVAPPQRQAGMCNSYLPNDTTLNRFLWVVNFFAQNGFYVLIDNHLREDQTVLQSPQQWVQDWVKLVTAISQDPVSKEKLMIDLLNEPDNFGIRWEASGSTPALKDLYLSAMDAIYAVNPDALFFIEGTGQGGIGANWGDGFATDPQLIQQNGLSDPNPFFQALLQKPYLNQVVISPHVYPPSVTNASTNYFGPGLWNRLTESFGYLTQQGYCFGGTCKIFPVALGEFGSRFSDSRDLQTMPDLAAYFNNTGAAADGKHHKISSWFYWSWNANSGDTGGIVADNWRDIIWQKVEYLTTIGLTPWYKSNTPVKTGTLCLSVKATDGLSASNLKPFSVGNYTFNVTAFDTPVCQSVAVGDYTVNAPQLVVGNQTFTAASQSTTVLEGQTSTVELTYQASVTPPPPPGAFAVTVQVGTPWQSAPNVYENVLNFYVKNTGSTAVTVPWTLAVTNNAYTGVAQAWNMNVKSTSNGTITAEVPADWEALQPNGGNTVNVGMIITSSSTDFTPANVTINGSPVTLTVTH
ncbi:cellulase family glycosylhydrolase [Candidatus Protochlamydia phocaeensis]|uniref:cellulase family glycosylhydrolase n=1 Tax=Candidatus Protochlamydia phocaeensis TaxID=1414722 RepID=UPI0008383960|nr:cellulase family glycosylhydrolase [Candidatus Protochlamydia phocaeensis]